MATRFFIFGRFTLDAVGQDLYCDGDRVDRLGRTAIKILHVLLKEQPSTVPHDSVIKEVWKDTTNVEYGNSLASHVTKLRKVLDKKDTAPSDSCIRSSKGVGYRFVWTDVAQSSDERLPHLSLPNTDRVARGGHSERAAIQTSSEELLVNSETRNVARAFGDDEMNVDGARHRGDVQYNSSNRELITSDALVHYLASRYKCEPITVSGRPILATALWQNHGGIITPDSLLGNLDLTPAVARTHSATMNSTDYAAARKRCEAKHRYEGVDYCMTEVDLGGDVVKLHGDLGLYYDTLLTQYAMEWEVERVIQGMRSEKDLASLAIKGTLPLRESVETVCDPLRSGKGRCAAISVSTLVVFKRPGLPGYYFIFKRRSSETAVSPGKMHVIPSGIFEMTDPSRPWSVEMNIWRELQEEVYNLDEYTGPPHAGIDDAILGTTPVRQLLEMINCGKAQLVVTGLCAGLLNLRPEICTLLFVSDPEFPKLLSMPLNWEYPTGNISGTGFEQWDNVDSVMIRAMDKPGVDASGAACVEFGRQWLARNNCLSATLASV
jgi:DNA-binding winged helix-turn-helix (wHTH) protein